MAGFPSHFSIQPDPPVEGQDVTVTYSGPEDTVYFQVDGGRTVPVPVKGRRKFVIPRSWLIDGLVLFLTTKKGRPGALIRWITR